MRGRLVVLSLVVVGLAAASGPVAAAPKAQITVYAAASLTDVFPQIDAGQKYSFGGSNTLAAQIRQGAPADVFASANMTLPNQLNASGTCSKPVVFTRNTLVIVVPSSNPAKLRSIYGLTRKGIKLVIAGSGVPVGSYTLQVLKNMNLSGPVLANVVSRETDVREVLAKVALGEADAGFVYATDVRAASSRLLAIPLPKRSQPTILYEVAIVKGSKNREAGLEFVADLLSTDGRRALKLAGFGLP